VGLLYPKTNPMLCPAIDLLLIPKSTPIFHRIFLMLNIPNLADPGLPDSLS
jgi:hypothetical protein